MRSEGYAPLVRCDDRCTRPIDECKGDRRTYMPRRVGRHRAYRAQAKTIFPPDKTADAVAYPSSCGSACFWCGRLRLPFRELSAFDWPSPNLSGKGHRSGNPQTKRPLGSFAQSSRGLRQKVLPCMLKLSEDETRRSTCSPYENQITACGRHVAIGP